jgi:uncharacterized protein (TIGR02996 family)
VTDRDALLSAALLAPRDDTPRLAYADLLQERDDPAEYARGRFLRAGVAAARFRHDDVIDDPAFYAALEDLAAVAADGHPARWVAALGPGPADDWGWDNVGDRVTVRVGAAAGVFERGMLAGLRVTLADWCAAAPAALAEWPVERVEVADVPGMFFYVEPPADGRTGWGLTAGLTILPRHPTPTRLARLRGTPDADYGPPPPPHRWAAGEEFPERAALVAGAATASARLADAIKGRAGSWWPARGR